MIGYTDRQTVVTTLYIKILCIFCLVRPNRLDGSSCTPLHCTQRRSGPSTSPRGRKRFLKGIVDIISSDPFKEGHIRLITL